jgi:hypothetical protein
MLRKNEHMTGSDKITLQPIICRDVDLETAKREVLDYFKRRGEAYPDEASQDLALDFDLVMKIALELRREGKLEVSEL